jgi:hypothetical protein
MATMNRGSKIVLNDSPVENNEENFKYEGNTNETGYM